MDREEFVDRVTPFDSWQEYIAKRRKFEEGEIDQAS